MSSADSYASWLDVMCGELRRGDWIQTVTGKRFYPIDPRPEDVDIMDIAHGLSNICRFGGQCLTHMPVAAHCIMVSNYVSIPAKMWGLMHDAAEAYIGDTTAPMKRCLRELFGDAFDKIEKAIDSVIIKKFGIQITDDIIAEVKEADKIVFATEARDLMLPQPENWRHDASIAIPTPIEVWTPGRSRWEFLRLFERLKKEKCH